MTDLPPETATDKEQKTEHIKVLALYIGFLFVVLFQFPLAPMVQIFSVILLFILVSCIGFIRKESEKDSYIYNHATFLSRTLWMWSFMLTISVVLAGIYISNEVKLSLEDVQSLSQDLMAGKTDSPVVTRLMPVGIAAMAPSTIYIFWRYAAGLMRAFKGNFMKRPRSFF
jgi:uncharacterized membrane protein